MPCVAQVPKMVPATFYILFLISSYLTFEAFEPKASSSTIKCDEDNSEIHFPFWLSTQQHHNSFQLFCEENITKIHFPTYGTLVVKSISYDIKKLDLLDPKNCVHEVFLNLDLSLTAFRYYYYVSNYTYLNCSTRLSPPLQQVPCLSGFRHHVYTVDPSFHAPASCRSVKTVAIPFAYSPYLSDNSFGLGLTWRLPLDEKIVKLKEGSSLSGNL